MKLSTLFLSAAVSTIALSIPVQSHAFSLTNADFETGDLTGWTSFTTSNGSVGGAGFPKVVVFDTSNTGTPSNSAFFNVGKSSGGIGTPPAEGGGIYQNVNLPNANISISAKIAANSPGNNVSGGIFQLLFDNVVLDTHDFGFINVNSTLNSSLNGNIANVSPGLHEIRFLITRIYGNGIGSTPTQYIDNVVVVPFVFSPTLGLSIISGLFATKFIFKLKSRKKN